MTKYILLVIALSVAVTKYSLAENDDAETRVFQGKEIAFDRRKGNCLACHVIAGGELPGNYGPPLVTMKSRFPDPGKLRAKIWDASIREPATRMPPYGRHKILTEDEIDLVVEFILTL